MTHLYDFLRPLACLLGLVLFSTSSLLAQEIIFEDDFEPSGTPFPKAEWTFTPGQDGLAQVASTVQGLLPARSGGFAAILGKSTSSGGFVTNTMDLALDLSGHSEVDLQFWLRSQGDETQESESGTEDGLFFSDDAGQSFVQVLPFRPGEWNDSFYGQVPPIDVDELAANAGLSLNENFVIRFQQHDDDDFVDSDGACYGCSDESDGFFIDDVVVTSPLIEYASLPYAEDFEDGSFGPEWKWAWPNVSLYNLEKWRLGSRVEVIGLIQGIETPHTGDFAAVIGRRNRGGMTTSALDLHLDLAGKTNVDMTFWLHDRRDETHLPDGLWFSDDGGETFSLVPVLAFAPGGWSDFQYGKLPPIDVDRLAANAGLQLTSTFVIRFQQHGLDDFRDTDGSCYGCNDVQDGFFIDDIHVYESVEKPGRMPFVEGFESGTLGAEWSIVDAEELSKSNPDPISESGAPVRLGSMTEVVGQVQGIQTPRSGDNAVVIGRRFPGAATTNALDLKLDLSSHSQATLVFWMRDLTDETQRLFDRVQVSDDGGQTFDLALEFDPSAVPDTYSRYHVDLGAVASDRGLSFNDQFVIRFQQQGEDDFLDTDGSCYGCWDREDGFFIDDVRVVNRLSETAVAAGDVVDELASSGISADVKQLSSNATLYLSQTDVSLENSDGLNLPSDGSGVPQLLGIDKVWHVDFDPAPASLDLDLCFDLAPFRTLFSGLGADVLNVVTRDETASAWTFVAATELRDATGAVVTDEADATQLCAVGLTETSEFAVTGPNDVLPVELSAFTAEMRGEEAVLAWTTASETGNAGFGVERSLDGGAFAEVGFVDGAGTTTEARSYRFADRSLPFGAQAVTYRLRQVDLDGTVAFSDAVVVRRGAPAGLALHAAFPNPVRGAATVRYELPDAGPVRLALYNVLGQQVQVVAEGEARAGRVEQTLDTRRLASGIYFLRLETPQGVRTQRLSVVR